MNRGIAFAGNLIVDQLKKIEAYPALSALTHITGVEQSMGGLACNCTVDLCKLAPELPVKVVGIVGSDGPGDYILGEFAKYPNLDTSGVLRDGITAFTDVMTQADGRRTFFTYNGANALLGPEHFDFDALEADILHIGYILLLEKLDGPDPDYPTALCRVLDEARKRGIQTSIDVVTEQGERFGRLVPPALRYADYCIINETEASGVTGIPLREEAGETVLADNFRPCLEKLAEMGASRWVVIHMPEFSCGWDVQTRRYHCEASWRIPEGFIKSSVGAGDAFAAGILLAAYRGQTLEEAIHTAGAAAAYSLSGAGASDALKPMEEILAEMESFQ